MSTQVQRRRGTQAENDAFTGALGEITVDTTNDRAVVHDGSTLGGHPLTTAKDVQNNVFTAAAGTLSAGVYSATIPKVTAYAEYQMFTIKPSANNVGAVDLNINSLGVKDINKDDGDGTLVELEADDIKANIPFDVYYNGTKFIARLGGGSAPAGLELIGTSTPTGVATVTFSSIPQTYRGLLLIIDGVSCNTATRTLLVTTDTGAGFHSGSIGKTITGTTITATSGDLLGLTTTLTAAQTISGNIKIAPYLDLTATGYFFPYSATTLDSAGSTVVVEGSILSTSGSGLISIRLAWSGSGNFDAGTINLYGIL